MSNNLKMIEKKIKAYSKRTKTLTFTRGTLISFLLTGGIGIVSQNAVARDLRTREANNIVIQNENGLNKDLSENGTDVINIVNPNSNGLSHNKYNEFNVGENNGVILNNSKVDGNSVLGGKVTANTNLTNNAKVILNEVKGNNASNLNGGIEVFGAKSDLIIANENGINVNGANFINTGALNLSTGRVNLEGGNLVLDTSKSLNSSLNIGEKGVTTDSDYFGLISRTVNINGGINNSSNKKTNINIIAGTNKVDLNTGNIESVKVDSETPSYAINGSSLGSMYGNNINIISTEKGAGVKHEGAIYSENDIDILVKGNLENIGGTIEAKKNVSLEADKVVNRSVLNGSEKVTTKEGDTKLHRRRGIIYYDHSVNINDVNIEDLDKLTVKEAKIAAGNNVEINRNTTGENRSIENIGGKIEAGKNIVLKGDVVSKDLQKEVAINDLLPLIKVNLRWEHRSLVNNGYFNGRNALNDGSLLDALKIIAQSPKNSGYYDALKQVENPTLNLVLNSVLGEDWRARATIKNPSEWNTEGKITLNTNANTLISAKENIVLQGGNIELGNKTNQKSKNVVVGNNTTEGMSNEITLGNSNNSIEAGKNILINGNKIISGNTNIKSGDDTVIVSKNDIDLFGTKVIGKNVLVDAKKDINLETAINTNGKGNQEVSKKTSLEGNLVNVKGNNVQLKGADITGNTRIDAESLGIDSQQLLNSSYEEKHIEGNKKTLNDHRYSTVSKGAIVSNNSQINGDNILINVNKNMDIKNSTVTGNDKNSTVVINVGENLNVSNRENVSYEKATDDFRGKDKETYKLVRYTNSETSTTSSEASNVISGKNLYVSAKNLGVKGSAINSGKDLVLDVDGKTTLNEGIEKKVNKLTDFSMGSSTRYTSVDSKEKTSNGSSIKGENIVFISKGDIENSGAKIEGNGKVVIKSDGNIINKAVANEKVSNTTNVTVGIVASGKVGIAGVGASGSINTLTNESSSSVSSVKDLLTPNKDYLGDIANGSVGVKLNVSNEKIDSKKWENGTIISKNDDVEIGSKGTLDIGGVDIAGKKDVSLTGSNIETTKYQNSETKKGNNFNAGITQTVDISNEAANKINSIVKDTHTIKDIIKSNDISQAEKVVETAKNIKKTAESFPELATKDILNVVSKQNVSLDYTHTINKETSKNTNSITSDGGKVSLESTKGDINLVGTNIKANDVMLDSKNNLNISAGEKQKFEETDGVKAGLTVTEKIGVNIKDGANAKVGLGVNAGYTGSTKLNNSGKDSVVEANNLVIKTEKDTNLNGAKLTANNVNLDTNNLNVTNTKTKTYEDSRGLGVNFDAGVGASSNTVILVDGSVSGNLSYTAKGGINVESQTGIVASNNFNGVVKGDVNNTGGLLKANNQKANLVVNGNENNKKDVTFEIEGGINASSSIGTNGENFKLNGNIDPFKANVGIINANREDKTEISIETKPIKDVITEEKLKKVFNGEK